MSRLVVLSVLGMIFFSSSTGWASTASVATTFEILYTAAPGESNAVVFTEEGSNVRISDPGATISAGNGCVLDGADALCARLPTFLELLVTLGDGDDTANLSGAGAVVTAVAGGAGNDQIVAGSDEGGNVFNAFEGGPGNDRLIGGSSEELFYGDGGDDQLFLGAGIDTGFGGPGNDTIRGGFGPDYLYGGLGDDLVVGGGGQDLIYGNPGNDRIAGRAGRDSLLGGWGADVLFSRDFERDEVRGGLGRDRARVDRLDNTAQIEVFFF